MQLTITRLNTKKISTRRGESALVSFMSSGVWYSSFEGAWNRGWENGQVLDIPDNRVTKTSKDGKTYWNIQAPPKDAGTSTAVDPAAGEKLDSILSGMREIYKEVMVIKRHLGLTDLPPRR